MHSPPNPVPPRSLHISIFLRCRTNQRQEQTNMPIRRHTKLLDVEPFESFEQDQLHPSSKAVSAPRHISLTIPTISSLDDRTGKPPVKFHVSRPQQLQCRVF